MDVNNIKEDREQRGFLCAEEEEIEKQARSPKSSCSCSPPVSPGQVSGDNDQGLSDTKSFPSPFSAFSSNTVSATSWQLPFWKRRSMYQWFPRRNLCFAIVWKMVDYEFQSFSEGSLCLSASGAHKLTDERWVGAHLKISVENCPKKLLNAEISLLCCT